MEHAAVEHLGFGSLWLPVVIVAVSTFIVSAIIWMAMPWHKMELKPLPDEEAVRRALHDQGVTEGQWRIPFSPNPDDWKSPEFQERFKTGPVGSIQLEKPGPMAMGPRMLKSFVLFFCIAFFTAYVLRHAFLPGEEYMKVFQMAASVSFACHFFGNVQDAIWFGKSWRRVATHAVDAVLYSLVTGGVFASMWPWA